MRIGIYGGATLGIRSRGAGNATYESSSAAWLEGNSTMSLNRPLPRRPLVPGLIVLFAVMLCPWPIAAAPIPVRFAEGSIHGFLILRSQEGKILAQGDLLEVARDGAIQKTTVFRFNDGSVFKETVVFTQQGVYTLQSYRLEQSGPAFTEDVRISLERDTGKYRVESQAHKGGPAKVFEGTLAMPPDVYNGMIPTIVKDLPKGTGETVHFVVFTPEPKIIRIEIAPAGALKVMVGEIPMTAVNYVLKPKLGPWLRILVTVLGRVPQDGHVWIIEGDVPALVGFEGQIYTTDPVWRVELVSPKRS